jgi:hypothetical protein
LLIHTEELSLLAPQVLQVPLADPFRTLLKLCRQRRVVTCAETLPFSTFLRFVCPKPVLANVWFGVYKCCKKRFRAPVELATVAIARASLHIIAPMVGRQPSPLTDPSMASHPSAIV